jgi:parallel beta-helix repeat protein
VFKSDIADIHHKPHSGHRQDILPREPAHSLKRLNVPRDFQTIQQAVRSAVPGDTINIDPGTYTEQVVIDKDLTITGSGASSTIIAAPTTLSTDSFGKRFIVEINNGAIVDLSRLTITGPSGCPTWGIGVMGQATLNLSSAAVTHIRDRSISECTLFGGTAILIGLPPYLAEDPVAKATITDVTIDDYSSHGIAVVGNGSTANLLHNVVTGVGGTQELNQVGIIVGFGAMATVRHNEISNNLCNMPSDCGPDPINQGQSVGIFTIYADADTEFSNNNLSNNDVGIYLYSSDGCCTTQHNTLTNNRFFGLVIQDGNNTMSHNTISGGSVGIAVVADSVDTVGTLEHNSISGTSIMPVQTIQSAGFTATANTTSP